MKTLREIAELQSKRACADYATCVTVHEILKDVRDGRLNREAALDQIIGAMWHWQDVRSVERVNV